MLDQISGYKLNVYDDLHDYHMRINTQAKWRIERKSFSLRMVNRLGYWFIQFGQWLIKITEMQKNGMLNNTDVCNHYGE
jgi:hypothetical protein